MPNIVCIYSYSFHGMLAFPQPCPLLAANVDAATPYVVLATLTFLTQPCLFLAMVALQNCNMSYPLRLL